MYFRIISSSNPTVLTQYPLAQKWSPVKLRTRPKYLDRCFATFSSRRSKKHQWGTVTQNVEEFTSRYLELPVNTDGRFPFQPAHRIGHTIFGGNTQTKMHMIRHRMAFD